MKPINYPPNLLPADGESFYFGRILSEQEEKQFFEILLKDVEWKQDEVIIFGKRIVTKRRQAGMAKRNLNTPTQKLPERQKSGRPNCLN